MTERKTPASRRKARPAGGGRAKAPIPAAPVTDADALRRSEERYRSVVTAMTEGMVLQTPDGTIVDCNEQAACILGLTRNQILGRTSRDSRWRAVREDGSPFPGEDHPAMIALKTGQPCRQVVMGLRLPKDGLRWINVNAEPLFQNGETKPHAVVVTFSNVTERTQAEAALREKERQFQLLTESIPVPAWTAAPDGKGGYCNRRWCEYTGQTPRQFTGLGWVKALHPDDVKKTIAQVAVATRRHDLFEAEYRLRRHDGVYRWHLARAYAARDAAGQITGWFGTTTDIHVQKTAQAELERRVCERTAELSRINAALRESEEKFSIAFKNSPTAMTISRLKDGWITEANAGFCALTGYDREELINTTSTAMNLWVDPSERLRAVKELQVQGKSEAREFRFRRKNGGIRHGTLSAHIVHLNNVPHLLTTIGDITERVRLEREVLNISDWERRRLAQDLHDGLGQLLVGAGFLADTLRKDLAPKTNRAAARLNRIQAVIHEATRQARDLARGVQPVAAEPNGLMSALTGLAEQTQETFRVRCDFNCRRQVLLKDNQTATHLFRIAQESVTNAIKHGKAKRLSIRLTRTQKHITLAVGDDGAGAKNWRRKKTGMGLHIMRYRAGIIGGTLTIQNKSAGGTTVVCNVPISDGINGKASGKKD